MRTSTILVGGFAGLSLAAPSVSRAPKSIPIGSGGYFDIIYNGEAHGCLGTNAKWQVSPCNVVTYETVKEGDGFSIWPVTGGGDQYLGIDPSGGDLSEGQLDWLFYDSSGSIHEWSSDGLFLKNGESLEWFVASNEIPESGADEAPLFEQASQTGSSNVVKVQLKWHASE